MSRAVIASVHKQLLPKHVVSVVHRDFLLSVIISNTKVTTCRVKGLTKCRVTEAYCQITYVKCANLKNHKKNRNTLKKYVIKK